MKTPLALIVAATSVFVFAQLADAQCDCQQTVSYYAPVATTAYYYAPTTAYYPTSAYYAPTTAYYGGGGYYGGGYYRSGYYDNYYRGGAFGTGLGGWAGYRGIDRRWDRRGW